MVGRGPWAGGNADGGGDGDSELDDGGRRDGLVIRVLGVSAAFYEYRARLGIK
jgi:hypothetical protein